MLLEPEMLLKTDVEGDDSELLWWYNAPALPRLPSLLQKGARSKAFQSIV